MDDLWDLKDADKIRTVFGTFEKNMQTGVRKAQQKLAIRHRKRKRRSAATDHRNGLSKAQSQDALVLVITASQSEPHILLPNLVTDVGGRMERKHGVIPLQHPNLDMFWTKIYGIHWQNDNSHWAIQPEDWSLPESRLGYYCYPHVL